jgi:hypothetical protein
MDNSLLIKYLLVWVFAFASVVGENSNNGGRAWNTNNGTTKRYPFFKIVSNNADDPKFDRIIPVD